MWGFHLTAAIPAEEVATPVAFWYVLDRFVQSILEERKSA